MYNFSVDVCVLVVVLLVVLFSMLLVGVIFVWCVLCFDL